MHDPKLRSVELLDLKVDDRGIVSSRLYIYQTAKSLAAAVRGISVRDKNFDEQNTVSQGGPDNPSHRSCQRCPGQASLLEYLIAGKASRFSPRLYPMVSPSALSSSRRPNHAPHR